MSRLLAAPLWLTFAFLFTLLSVAGVSALGYAADRGASSALLEHALDDQRTQAALQASAIRASLDGSLEELASLGRVPPLVEGLDGTGPALVMQSVVAGFTLARPHVAGVALFDPAGAPVFVTLNTLFLGSPATGEPASLSPALSPPGTGPADLPVLSGWQPPDANTAALLSQVRTSGDAGVGLPRLWARNGHPVLELAAPIRTADGRVVGFSVAAVSLQTVSASLSPSAGRSAQAQRMLLLAGPGRAPVLLIRQPAQLVVTPPSWLCDAECTAGRPAKLDSRIVAAPDGRLVVAHAPVVETEWVAVTVESESSILAPAAAMRRAVVPASAAVLAIAIATAAVFGRLLAAPLAQLAHAARALGRGDAGVSLPQMGSGEVGTLAVAFASMRDDVARLLESERHAVSQALASQADAQQHAAYQQALNELTARLNATLDLDAVCDAVVTHVSALVGALRCVVLHHDPADGLFRYQAVWDRGHLQPAVRTRAFPARLGGRVLRCGAPVVVADTRTSDDPAMRDRAQSGILAVIAVPITVAGAPWGVLQVGLPEAGATEQHRVDLLTTVATHVSLAIRNAELYTDLRQSNDQLLLTQAQVVQQERLRALGQMASGIAHDLNNALAPVVGFSELLLEIPANLEDRDKARRYLELIRTGAADAANVVTRLREFYRHREQHDVLASLDLVALVAQVVGLTEPKWKDQAQAAGLTVTVQTDLGAVPALLGSESELREALINLVFNAVDAMPRGGTLTLRTYAEPGSGWGIVEVADTGVGMPEDVRRRCLEPFFTTKGEQGTGLGLSMVLGIVERHGGTIGIESAPGAGTRLILRLPPAPAETDSLAHSAEPTAGETGRPLRLLVVDDEPAVRRVIEAILSAEGHSMVEASGAREALALLDGDPFDAVLTDRAMPGMNGEQLALAIRRSWPELPVILVTGFGDFMAAGGERPAGVHAVVAKPINRHALRAALKSALQLQIGQAA